MLAAAHLYKHFTSSLNVKSLADLHVLTTCGAGKLQLQTFFYQRQFEMSQERLDASVSGSCPLTLFTETLKY